MKSYFECMSIFIPIESSKYQKNSNKQLAYIKVEHNPKYLLQLTQYVLHLCSNYTLSFVIDQQLKCLNNLYILFVEVATTQLKLNQFKLPLTRKLGKTERQKKANSHQIKENIAE